MVSKLIGLGFLVLLVADREETYLRLDPLTRTNFTNVVRIPTYTYDQALAILSERAKLSLREWSYGEAVVKKIAQQCKGNIALGLNTLKTAAHNAESENRVKIEENDVPNIDCPEFELNQDEKVLLKILQEWKSLPSSRLYAFYREKAKYPKEERSFRNYVRNLASKGLVRAIGEKSGRMYEVTDQGDMDPKSDA